MSAQNSLLLIDVGELEADHLGGAQPACIHQLEQRAVAQGAWLGALRPREQSRDLGAREHLRQLAAAPRPAQVGCRVVRDHVLAAQVAIEGAHARELALQRAGAAERESRNPARSP